MTDIVSRQATPVEQLSPADQSAGLDIQLRRAEAIAGAAGMLPAAYRGKPGAILLAEQWGASRGIDLLTTMQTVSFYEGKPLVDATMLRALTERAGYDYDIDTDDQTYATFSITRDGWPAPKSATFTKGDAQDANLLGKTNWKGYLGDMLVARATTRCLRRHAPGVMVGIFIRDEVDEPFEAQLSQTASSREDPVDVLIPPESDDEHVYPWRLDVDAEIVEEDGDQAEVDERTVEEISGDPRDAVFDTPPATTMPKAAPDRKPAPPKQAPATEAPTAPPAEVDKITEVETPAAFKARIRADYPGWNSVSLLKAMAAAGHSKSIDEILASKTLYTAALDLLEGDPK